MFSSILEASVWSNIFWYVIVCIFWKCIQYTIDWDKTQFIEKLPSDKLSGTKYVLFFIPELRLITVLLSIWDSSMGCEA